MATTSERCAAWRRGRLGTLRAAADALLDPDAYDEIRLVDEAGGLTMARRLAAEEGLLAGVSSSGNIAGAIALAQELGPGKTVCTVAVDTGLKYLAGDVFGR